MEKRFLETHSDQIDQIISKNNFIKEEQTRLKNLKEDLQNELIDAGGDPHSLGNISQSAPLCGQR